MKNYKDIKSNLEALKLKDIEKNIYRNAKDGDLLIPKVIPFKGVNTDILYIRNNSILFIKFMDTTEELFSFLDEEILEIMNEEYELLCKNMSKHYPNIHFNYIFAMPNIEFIEEKYDMVNFIDKYVIVGNEAKELAEDTNLLDKYLSKQNDEIELSMFIFGICNEYFTVTEDLNLNPFFKKISFKHDDISYKVCMLEEKQITEIASANYGNHLIVGGSGTGKSSLLLGRIIKLSKIYPHHKFLLLSFTKQQCNRYKELLEILNVDTSNIEVFTFSSFIFKLAKANNLVINYNMLKKNYDKSFINIMKQINNTMKNKKMYKGIFVDEAENFSEEEIILINEFLYSTKNIFNASVCKAYNINNNLNIFKCNVKAIEYEDEIYLDKNYRQGKEIVEFVNGYCDRANNFVKSLRENIETDVYKKTNFTWENNKSVNIVRVEDLDDQISSVIWEVQHMINDLGYSPEDIAIVYPYNKKRLKNGKMIYFQYMLRKSLEDTGIEYIFADDTVTNITPKDGITISNIYSIKSLSYKVIVLCELEMLYNHNIEKDSQDYQVNDFVGDLNKVYTGMTRAEECLSIIVSYTSDNSDIIRILGDI
ncbi:AAA family ATPase [Peptostreptococcus russellii]|uniref:UvrD-helicase domain-containing protein n=1 Tax=Peptostreptococcus russellii TaxID=215200 RepID=UPI0016296846|nr:UvrD-helicase domain-containing protein [Peptostreptococcus russellii]MBC2577297.1 AAA family ATPase [Peptostreptococcus russellii]